MSVKALAHICIHTNDLEKTRKFYCEILGFKKIFNFTKKSEVIGFYLKINKSNFIEIFKDGTAYSQNTSFKHFCLETIDIQKMKDKLNQAGIETSEIKLGCDQTYQFWFKDPSGIDVEFHKYTSKSSQKTGKDIEIDW